MRLDFSEWEPLYREICAEFCIDPLADESSVRLLEAVTQNLDLDDEDCFEHLLQGTVTIFGAADSLKNDVGDLPPEGTLIAAGSACRLMTDLGFRPDILVTDLDGDVESQIAASADGAVTLILAHSDNTDAVARYAPLFKGKVVLTTQCRPRGNVLCFGGFTDGDRAVCLARHFGARRILLEGFDFDHPGAKEGSDPARKLRKLAVARRVITSRTDDLVLPKR